MGELMIRNYPLWGLEGENSISLLIS